MSAKAEKLLSLYRQYETLVRDAGEDPLAVEDNLPELESAQLRITRQFRNFLAHQPAPGFLEPTDKMLRFLENRVTDWAMRGDVAGKHLQKPATALCRETDPCTEGLKKLSKLKMATLPVLSEHGSIRLCDLFAIAAAVASDPQAMLSNVPSMRAEPVFVSPTAPIEGLDLDRVNICTKDGTPQGKILGVVHV